MQFPSRHRRRVLTHTLCAFLFAWGAAMLVYGSGAWAQIPVLAAETFSLPQSIMVTDRDGRELIRFHEGYDVVELKKEDMPEYLRSAFVAIEDRRFRTRPCVDVRALARAGVATFFEQRVEGASTITQQLVGLLLENRREKTVRRKANELLLACRMEWSMSRDDILTLYLNRVPFGGNIYGVEQASRTFFGRHARDITVAQAAILAALPQRPTALSPYGSGLHSYVSADVEERIRKGEIDDVDELPEDQWMLGLLGHRYRTGTGTYFTLPGRANLVLDEMRGMRLLSAAQYRDVAEDLRRMRFKPLPSASPDAPYFVRQLREDLPRLLQSTPELRAKRWSGITIRTTLDRDIQTLAETVIAKYAEQYRRRFGVQNLSLVAIDRRTREVIAYVGNVSPENAVAGNDYDMANVPRQPGSSFKPFVYAAAFETGKLTPNTRILDGPLQIGRSRPRNYEGGFRGWMYVKNALAASRNIPAIRAFLMAGGEDVVLQTASDAGIRTPSEHRETERAENGSYTYGWPLAIGTAEIPLWEMVQGYATIANEGMMQPLQSIVTIAEAEDEQSLIPFPLAEPTRGMDPEAARELTDILKDENLRPAGGWRRMLDTGTVETAAKTGTSNQCRGIDVRTGQCSVRLPSDTWTIGYSPSLVVGVWGGNASFAALSPQADGLDVAAPIWREFIMQAHELRPEMAKAFDPGPKKAVVTRPLPLPLPASARREEAPSWF